MRTSASCLVWLVITAAAATATATPPSAEPFLVAGELKKGEATLRMQLATQPKDDQARFGLGVIQYFRAAERLSQDVFDYGFFGGGLLVFPVPNRTDLTNPTPNPVTYDRFRTTLATFLSDLEAADSTLAPIDNPKLKLRLPAGRIRLDLDGDGIASDKETLAYAYSGGFWNLTPETGQSLDLSVALDQADVHWIRGQCRFYMACCEILLAYDWSKMWNHASPLLFAKAVSPIDIRATDVEALKGAELAAVVLHLVDWKIQHPKRMKRALTHLETSIEQFELCFVAAAMETDNDQEWIPNDGQSSIIPKFNVRQGAVNRLRTVLQELKRLLKREKLLPLLRDWPWRWSKQGTGVNIRRMFTEPRDFDLVLWIQGSEAAPYLEKGELSAAFWRSMLNAIIEGDFQLF